MSKEIVNKRQIETSQLDRLEQRIIDLAYQQTMFLKLDNKQIFALLEKAEAENVKLNQLVADNAELKEQIGRYEDMKKLIMLTKESTAKDSVLHKYCLEFLEPLTTPPKENTDD